MKIRLLSDLHLESYREPANILPHIPVGQQDVVVLAGDIVSWGLQDKAIKTLRLLSLYFPCPIVYVLGNHEYYKHDGPELDKTLLSINSIPGLENLHYLRDGLPIEVLGRRFIGGTMWYGFRPDNHILDRQMLDSRSIGNFVPWVYDKNKAFESNIYENMREGDIVVTHHMPSNKCIHPKYKRSSLNRFFVCEQDALIVDRKPALWLHGHTHESLDIMVGNTRVVCNPKGYQTIGEGHTNKQLGENPLWNPSLVLEVPDLIHKT